MWEMCLTLLPDKLNLPASDTTWKFMKASQPIAHLGSAGPAALLTFLGLFTTSAADTNIIGWRWASGVGPETNAPPMGTNVIALAGSDNHCVALLADRTVRAWGHNTYGQTNIPPDATNVVGIAAGNNNGVAATADGMVRMWGRLYSTFPAYVPAEATNVVALGVGRGALHTVALRADGTVVDWGWSATTKVPAAAFNIVGVAAGSFHGLAVRADGRVIAWGDNTSGQTTVPASATNIVAVAAGERNSLAVRADGTLLRWGTIATPPASATNVVEVGCCKNGEALVLRRDGTVVGWGASVAINATNIMAIGADSYGALAVKAAGPPIFPFPAIRRVVASGQTAYLRLRAVGALPLSYQWTFQGTNVPGATKEVLAITNAFPSQSGFYSLVASNALGIITNTDMELVVAPIIITNQPTNQIVYAGATTTLSVGVLGQSPIYQWSFNGTNIAWGTNSSLILTNVQLTDAGAYSVSVSNAFGGVMSSNALLAVWPIIILSQPQPTNQAVYVGANPTLNVSVSGQVPLNYQWSLNGTNIAWATNSSLTITNIQLTDAGTYSITVTNQYGGTNSSTAFISVWPILVTQVPKNVVIFRGGTTSFDISAQAGSPLSYQWQFLGTNLSGATANTLTLTNVMYEQAGLYSVILSTTNAMATNSAMLSVVQVAAWGDNSYGQRNVPANLTNVLALANAGIANHCLALHGDGTVTGWGWNYSGQDSAPSDLTNAVAIAAGASFSLALRADGTTVGWGSSSYGQATPPTGLTNVVAVAVGWLHSAALRGDGTVVAWGYNSHGETNVPVGLINVAMIAACNENTVALKTDGTIVAWGDNSYHQTNVPAGLTNAVAVAAGRQHNLALRTDGTVVGWGDNGFGQTNVPAGLSNVVAIAAGGYHSLALKADGSLVGWGYNNQGQTNLPTGLTNVVAIAGGSYYSYALVGGGPPAVNGLPLNPLWANGVFSVSLVSQNSRVYRLEHKDNLSDRDWVAHPLVAGTGGMLAFTDPTAIGTQRYYRISRW